MTIDDREATVGRATYRLNYLQLARGAIYWRIVLP
jgi:hypothetical protein